MPSLTRSDLVTRVGELINDPNHTRWSTSQKQERVEEAQERFVVDTRCLINSSSTSVVAGTAEYSLPTDILDIERVTHNGIELTRMSKADFDFYTNRNWASDQGRPERYYVDLDPDNKKIGLYPKPQAADAGSSNLIIDYVQIPTELSSDSSTPFNSHTLLTPYHMAIVYWAAKELLNADMTPENQVKARQYMKEYEDLVAHCVNLFRSMKQSSPMRLKGGRYYKGL